MNEKLAELIGLMMGDGCLSRSGRSRRIYIAGHKIDDYEYHNKTTLTLFKEIFNKDIKIRFRNKENALFIRFHDKIIFLNLARYLPIGLKYNDLAVPAEILQNKMFFFAFMRGLVDTDGCFILSKQHKNYRYYPRVEITSKSKKFLLVLLLKLREENFYGSVSHKGKQNYRLEIPGHQNLQLWMEKIGFNNQKHWKKVEGYLSNPPQRPWPDSQSSAFQSVPPKSELI